MLQTPSKGFRHWSLPKVMWGMSWEVKSMSGVVKSSYGGKLFLHICKLEWFKSKNIWVDGNVFICSQGPYRAVNSGIYLNILCTEEILTVCMCASTGYVTSYLGNGERGFLLCDVASLELYCIDAPQRIVTKVLYRTALPFSILNDWHINSWIYLHRVVESGLLDQEDC